MDAILSPTAQTTTALSQRYIKVRNFSETIAGPLTAEDCAMQTMPDVSPTRWHLAHTTWFFETFLLKHSSDYTHFDTSFEHLFNSYYNTIGEQFPRHRRGQISRPGLDTTRAYRKHVDQHVIQLFERGRVSLEMWQVLELGLHHEQQHQELMLTDIKHVLSCNPLYPVYAEDHSESESSTPSPLSWEVHDERLTEVGFAGSEFAFDNELPRHKTFIPSHAIASRCITNEEYRQFIDDKGYERPELWLSLGWQRVQEHRWQTPLYWVQRDSEWHEFTLSGLRPIRWHEPVCHISFFEADAFARWAGHRLPTEFEWEATAASKPIAGVFSDHLFETQCPIHPQPEGVTTADGTAGNLYGNLWEWTASQYLPYPGFSTAEGALGEYNGKFMCNQFVLRGGSCATASDHIRTTYRNFFPPEARWQFTGIRLAKSH